MLKSTGVMQRVRRYVCLGLLVSLAPLAVNCFGQFPLTRAIYQMNRRAGADLGEDQTQHRMVQSVLMWVLVIIPVYNVGMLADVVALNLIEFWTGDPVVIGSTREDGGIQVSLTPSMSGVGAMLKVSENGTVLMEQHVVKVSDTVFEMRDSSGNLMGKAIKTSTGDIQLTNALGLTVETLAAEDLVALTQM